MKLNVYSGLLPNDCNNNYNVLLYTESLKRFDLATLYIPKVDEIHKGR